MKKNVLTKFREFFNNLPFNEQEDLWAVLVALRGEDGGNPYLKHYTTSRIRGELLEKNTVLQFGCIMWKDIEKIAEYQKEHHSLILECNFVEAFHKSTGHWRRHIEKAINVLLKYHPRRCKDLKKFIK